MILVVVMIMIMLIMIICNMVMIIDDDDVQSDVSLFVYPSRSGLVGSAVCSYSVQSIQSLFSTSKYLKEVQMPNPSILKSRVWKSVPPPTNGEIPGRPQVGYHYQNFHDNWLLK